MTDREREIVRLALLFLTTEMPQALELFRSEDASVLDVNGDTMDVPTEEEIGVILNEVCS